MKPVVFHRLAQKELDKAVARHSRQRRGLGLKFLTEFERVVKIMRLNPQIGTPFNDTNYRYCVLRRFPYVIYYEDVDPFLWIIAVAHGSRRLGYWKRRKLE